MRRRATLRKCARIFPTETITKKESKRLKPPLPHGRGGFDFERARQSSWKDKAKEGVVSAFILLSWGFSMLDLYAQALRVIRSFSDKMRGMEHASAIAPFLL